MEFDGMIDSPFKLRISDSVFNMSFLITGGSGSGKSTAVKGIEIFSLRKGDF